MGLENVKERVIDKAPDLVILRFGIPPFTPLPRVLLHVDPESDLDRVIRANVDPLHQPGNDRFSDVQLKLF